MKRLFSSIKKIPLSITNNAWNKMGEIITTKNAKSFIFSCIGSGCNGYSYQLKLLNKEETDDFEMRPSIGFSVNF